MRELGFVAALVLVIFGFIYFSSLPAGTLNPDENATGTRYTTAINAAKNVSTIVGAEKRRKWVVSLGMKAYDGSSALRNLENPIYSVEGENSEYLVVTSTSMTSGLCTLFAESEYGVAASKEGFTDFICRDSSTGASYQVSLSPSS